MIELFAAYEAAASVPRETVKAMQNAMVRRELARRGLTEADIISRETIVDADPVEWSDPRGEKRTDLRYCDKITIPGDD